MGGEGPNQLARADLLEGTAGQPERAAAGMGPEAPDHRSEPEELAPDPDEEDLAPDVATDPLTEGNPDLLKSCNYAFFAGLQVREAITPDGDQLRRAMRETLAEAPGPEGGAQMSEEMKGKGRPHG